MNPSILITRPHSPLWFVCQKLHLIHVLKSEMHKLGSNVCTGIQSHCTHEFLSSAEAD